MATSRPTFRIEHTPDRQINQLQRSIDLVFRALSDPPWLFGVDLRGLTFTAAETKALKHGLARQPQGFLVIDAQGAPALLVRGACTNDTIELTSSNAGTYAVRVY